MILCNDIVCDLYDTINGIHYKFLQCGSMLVCLFL